MWASSGRKSICPVAVLAVSTPITVPRRATNQRLTTVAPSTIAVVPVPRPTRIPQVRTSCQLDCICEVRATPAQITASETRTVRRIPNRSISGAARRLQRQRFDRLRGSNTQLLAKDAREMTRALADPAREGWHRQICRGVLGGPGDELSHRRGLRGLQA